jgi:hypothetical protein
VGHPVEQDCRGGSSGTELALLGGSAEQVGRVVPGGFESPELGGEGGPGRVVRYPAGQVRAERVHQHRGLAMSYRACRGGVPLHGTPGCPGLEVHHLWTAITARRRPGGAARQAVSVGDEVRDPGEMTGDDEDVAGLPGQGASEPGQVGGDEPQVVHPGSHRRPVTARAPDRARQVVGAIGQRSADGAFGEVGENGGDFCGGDGGAL